MKKHNLKPESFYTSDSYPSDGAKDKMWRNINNEIQSGKNFGFQFDFRNFAIGFGAAIVVFFFFTGVYFSAEKILSNDKPQNLILSETYSRAVDNFERALPVVLEEKKSETEVDELINVRREELDTLTSAIQMLKTEIKSSSSSDIKYQRLIDLYRMKMKIIDSILELEAKRK
ncbi:MAG: hypothetical protein SCALA702_14530 [Melioribacteraceae bacterium]|nr:MAG: hypothetical protein SCALA702_14530 [Melioribacteraceae bacterium]